MSEPAASPTLEARLAQALVEAGADRAFQHDGLIYFLVPKWVVEAYALARVLKASREGVLSAVIGAHFGRDAYAEFAENPKCMGMQIGRAWAVRCADLERRVRGLGGAATQEAAA